VNPFSKSIEVVILGQDRLELNELIFIHELGVLSAENNVSG
jgi:hypothetical protein